MQVARDGEAAEPRRAGPSCASPLPVLRPPACAGARHRPSRDRRGRGVPPARRGAAQRARRRRSGWLWLTRPDGWKTRLEELRKKQQQAEHAAHDVKVERESQRRLAGAEDRARRAEVALGARIREAEEAKAALGQERALAAPSGSRARTDHGDAGRAAGAAKRRGPAAQRGRGRARAADRRPAPCPPRDPHARSRARAGGGGAGRGAAGLVAIGPARQAGRRPAPSRRLSS